MFDKLGQIFSLIKNGPRLQEELQRFQQTLGNLTAEGDAGAGMVKVKVNGRREMVNCQISDDLFRSGDKELLEDLVRAATNQACEKVTRLVAEQQVKLFTGLGFSADMLPPGMNLPGM
jgi:DNA-binding YbaB/EbfC family protein